MSTILQTAKFRPVLSGQLISHALSLARKDNSSLSQELIQALAIYEFKIQNEILKPAYISEIKEDLSTSLGFTIPEVNEAIFTPEALYNHWLHSPDHLNLTQLKMVRTYRYEQNKMTEDEEKLFEKEVLGMSY